MDALPFREVWAVDFEYLANDGERPRPVCFVGRELRSGRLVRRWLDGPTPCPITFDDQTLLVAYMAVAELSCFLELGWPLPTRVLDLYVEFRAQRNGTGYPFGRSLLDALTMHGLSHISAEEKHEMRALILDGGPWSSAERHAILDYCQSDVDALRELLPRMLSWITRTPRSLGQALLRGRYMTAVAHMERAGIPIDVSLLTKLREHWRELKLGFIDLLGGRYGIYDDGVFKTARFEAYLREHHIGWERTPTGRPKLDGDTFRDAADIYPELQELAYLRHILSDLRLEQLEIGSDGHNRTTLFPFKAVTGRNLPSSARFIFGPSAWIRGLIKPEEGRALAYLDFSAQEVGIAAVLSGDKQLRAAVESGDPYLTFAKLARLAPDDATKASHETVRNQCKRCLLGSHYGMGAQTLAQRLNISLLEADNLQRSLTATFPTYAKWAENSVDIGMLSGQMQSVFGWPIDTRNSTAPSLRNFPMQANGAEMLRLACCLATERGVQVAAPIHDALLIEAPVGEIDEAAEITSAAMREASRAVLVDLELKADAKVVRYPRRYADPRGVKTWMTARRLLRSLHGPLHL